MHIRLLTAEDVENFRTLRLRGLQENPEAFGSSPEEFTKQPLATTIARITPVGDPPERFVLGAFDTEDRLLGVVGLMRENGLKDRHKADIWGMYVASEAQGQGIGRALMQAALARAREIAGVEQVKLAVSADNTAARKLYASLGFRIYGTEPRALKLSADTYLDEELMILMLG